MEKNLIFDNKPKFIHDLGSGYSNVYLNIEKVIMKEEIDHETHKTKDVEKWKCDVQRVKNPVTYESTVDSVIKKEYPNGEDLAILRKGIINPKDPEFLEFNNFVENIKKSFKEQGIKSMS